MPWMPRGEGQAQAGEGTALRPGLTVCEGHAALRSEAGAASAHPAPQLLSGMGRLPFLTREQTFSECLPCQVLLPS